MSQYQKKTKHTNNNYNFKHYNHHNNYDNYNYYEPNKQYNSEQPVPNYENEQGEKCCVQHLEKNKRDRQFGDDVESHIKHELIDYVYNKLDLYQLRYCFLKTEEHAKQLKQQTYHVTPHFQGYNYYLIFKRLSNGIVGTYLIYSLDLKFKKEDLDIENIKMYKINMTNIANLNLINELDDTILFGKIVFKKEQKQFLIIDMYYFCGKKYLSFKLIDKYEFLNNELSKISPMFNNIFELKIIKLYKYSDMADLIYNKIRNSDFKINGLLFLPIRTGKYFIYINDNEFENIKKFQNIDINENVNNVRLPNDVNFKNKKLLLQKTQIVDVYEVFTLDKITRFNGT